MAQKISALAVGAKVRDTKTKYNGVPIGFLIADKGHSGYPSGSVTLVTDKIITLKCFDAKESGGNNDRVNYGNNRYILSNIRQWLNKSVVRKIGQQYLSGMRWSFVRLQRLFGLL